MKIILWEACHFNKVQAVAWNYKASYQKLSIVMHQNWRAQGTKEQKTMFLVVSWWDARFGFARQFFAYPIGRASKIASPKNQTRFH